MESAIRDDAAGHQNRTQLWARAEAAAREQLQGAAKGTHPEEREERRKMQGVPSSHDLAENRAVWIAHGDRMRFGELHCEMSEVAEVFHPERLEPNVGRHWENEIQWL